MTVTGIAHVCMGARDLAATEAFYCTGLGFRKHFEFVRDGAVVGFYLDVANGTYIEVFQQDGVTPDAAAPIRHVCFEVDDIEAACRRLAAGGYESTAPRHGSDQSLQAWTTDPSGARIELHQYTENSSQLTGRDCVLK